MNNPPAFPTPPTFAGGEYDSGQSGMTLRDYFAAAAMIGMYADGEAKESQSYDKIAHWSYAQADAMLKAREQ